ncbi:hypothetical protein HDU84_004287 [Entophlyctis sp. JEL0112]|nr:hypothetical protein HDU84_004287 [Entophlyctis sp. JEL0112]
MGRKKNLSNELYLAVYNPYKGISPWSKQISVPHAKQGLQTDIVFEDDFYKQYETTMRSDFSQPPRMDTNDETLKVAAGRPLGSSVAKSKINIVFGDATKHQKERLSSVARCDFVGYPDAQFKEHKDEKINERAQELDPWRSKNELMMSSAHSGTQTREDLPFDTRHFANFTSTNADAYTAPIDVPSLVRFDIMPRGATSIPQGDRHKQTSYNTESTTSFVPHSKESVAAVNGGAMTKFCRDNHKSLLGKSGEQQIFETTSHDAFCPPPENHFSDLSISILKGKQRGRSNIAFGEHLEEPSKNCVGPENKAESVTQRDFDKKQIPVRYGNTKQSSAFLKTGMVGALKPDSRAIVYDSCAKADFSGSAPEKSLPQIPAATSQCTQICDRDMIYRSSIPTGDETKFSKACLSTTTSTSYVPYPDAKMPTFPILGEKVTKSGFSFGDPESDENGTGVSTSAASFVNHGRRFKYVEKSKQGYGLGMLKAANEEYSMCDRGLPACSRCVRRGVDCSYPAEKTSTRLDALTPTSVSQGADNDLSAHLSSLSQRISALETSVSMLIEERRESHKQNADLAPLTASVHHILELRDMMPTFQDWSVVCSYYNNKQYSIMGILRGMELLESFFMQPPYLWLTICAIAAQLSSPKQPESIRYSYYVRAQNSLLTNFRSTEFRMFQSLMIFSAFSLANGNPGVGRPFYSQAITLLLKLRLDYDPDDSPWLSHLNLSHKDKELRRIGFWVAYHSWKFVEIALSDHLPFRIENSRVKFPERLHWDSPLYDDYPERTQFAMICYLCAILDVLGSAARVYYQAPRSVSDMLTDPSLASVQVQLASAKSQIPSYLILDDKSSDPLNNLGQFIADFRKTEMKVTDTMTATLLFHATVCVSNRSLFYLTGYLPSTSKYLSDESVYARITSALDCCLTSARTILLLVSWLYHRSDAGIDGEFGRFRRKFWKEYTFYSMTIFEAVVVLWFASCRTKDFWWKPDDSVETTESVSVLGSRLRMTIHDRQMIRTQITDALNTLKGLEEDLSPKSGELLDSGDGSGFGTSLSNMVSPLIEGITCMLVDIQQAETGEHAQDIGARIIGWKMSALSSADLEPVQSDEARPWVLLGPLGAKFGGCVGWNARCTKRGLSCSYRPTAILPDKQSELQDQVRELTARLAAAENALSASSKNALNSLTVDRNECHPPPEICNLVPWTIEDPDLIPTSLDWFLMESYCTLTEPYDLNMFLHVSVFSRLSAPLRLGICLISAHELTRKSDDNALVMSYYLKAKRAIIRWNVASVDLFKSLILLSRFLLLNGQPSLADRYFFRALRMVSAIGLDVDPDLNPFLSRLPDFEKEERRLCFWVAVPSKSILRIEPRLVKFPKKSLRGQKLPEHATVCYLSAFMEIIYDCVYEHHACPGSVEDIFHSEHRLQLLNRLLALESQLPADFVLSHFKQNLIPFQCAQFCRDQVLDAVMISIHYHATICVINRPMLYLTHFLTLTSISLQNPENLMLVLQSLQSSLASAQVISELASWLLHTHDSVPDTDLNGVSFRKWLWKNHAFSSMMLFEAVIVLWFATCRTLSFWFEDSDENVETGREKILEYRTLRMCLEDRRRIRGQVTDILRTLRDLEEDMSASKRKSSMVEAQESGIESGSFSSMLTPMITCGNAMVEEMVQMEAQLGGDILFSGQSSVLKSDQDEILIGLKVVSISDAEPEEPECPTDEPWVLLGLMGVEVGNLRWNAFYEEEWREFWQRVRKREQGHEDIICDDIL